MIIPQFLRSGDKVGVVATAKKVHKAHTLEGIEVLKSWGLEVEIGRHVFASYHQFAGTDGERRADLQQMIDDPEIKAIFMVRGGYGSTRIIDSMDFMALFASPKWICGFSDVTAFHLHLYNLGMASIHSPMPSFFYALNPSSLQWLRDLVFGKNMSHTIHGHSLNRFGVATGKITGGNLSIICHTIGTASQIDTKGQILFLEDVGENLYHLDRMMVQLKRAGFLDGLTGLIVGQFSDMKDNEDSFGTDANGIVLSHVRQHEYPVAFDFPIGHTNENYAVTVGLEAKLSVDATGSTLELYKE